MKPDESSGRSLGVVVRERREALGLTKSELARRAHVTRSTLHEIETGQRSFLQAHTYLALDDALEWAAGTLRRRVSGEPDPPADPPSPIERLAAEILLAVQALTEMLRENHRQQCDLQARLLKMLEPPQRPANRRRRDPSRT